MADLGVGYIIAATATVVNIIRELLKRYSRTQ